MSSARFCITLVNELGSETQLGQALRYSWEQELRSLPKDEARSRLGAQDEFPKPI